MHRGWTLQEVLAPAHAFVLFSWANDFRCQFPAAEWGGPWILETVVEYQSAMVDVLGLLSMGLLATSRASKVEIQDKGMLYVKTFGSSKEDHAAIMSLIQAKSEETEEEMRNLAIWRCSFMRTSSRPVDMVFCIMGLFGITLDPHAFHPRDRVGATAALARELLRKGHGASWLGISFALPPSKQLAFPEFPRTIVHEEAHVQIDGRWHKVRELIDDEDLLYGTPKGDMDDAEYLVFRGKAIGLCRCVLVQCPQHVHFVASDGSLWIFLDPSYNPDASSASAEAFAVVVGNDPVALATKALLLKEHRQGQFHIVSYFQLVGEHYAELVKQWEVWEFSVGGVKMTQVLCSRNLRDSLKQTHFELLNAPSSGAQGAPDNFERLRTSIKEMNNEFSIVFDLDQVVPYDPLSDEFQEYWQDRMSKERRLMETLRGGICEVSEPLDPSSDLDIEEPEDLWEFEDLYEMVQKFSGTLEKREKADDGFTTVRHISDFSFSSILELDDWKDLDKEQSPEMTRFGKSTNELWTEAGFAEALYSMNQSVHLGRPVSSDGTDSDESV
ncbi:hypothetical protein OBBRIDRAFT_160710 [Obba rivulosa]|uniref:Uncharacterized protein n=1 Tax=Obba rivulosa TaxID=1052685 RepID=A0A8E2AVB7_9APHY|nr:hypothetical protein OBBRIDRAFT_160710 [Obba rivulosa]